MIYLLNDVKIGAEEEGCAAGGRFVFLNFRSDSIFLIYLLFFKTCVVFCFLYSHLVGVAGRVFAFGTGRGSMTARAFSVRSFRALRFPYAEIPSYLKNEQKFPIFSSPQPHRPLEKKLFWNEAAI